jgi:hypothetical protein
MVAYSRGRRAGTCVAICGQNVAPADPAVCDGEGRCEETYACQLGAAVTALGSSALLLDVQVTVLAARSPDDADLVGDRVVRLPSPLQTNVLAHRCPHSRLIQHVPMRIRCETVFGDGSRIRR